MCFKVANWLPLFWLCFWDFVPNQTGECTKGENCTYAHFSEELRKQSYTKPYIKETNGQRPPQMGLPPARQLDPATTDMIRQETTVLQLRFLVEQLSEFYKNDRRFEEKLKIAKESITRKETEKTAEILEVTYSGPQ